MSECQEAIRLVEIHLSPRTIDPGEYFGNPPGRCPICRSVSLYDPDRGKDVVFHEDDCFWKLRKVVHVRGEIYGEASGEFERYKLYSWDEENENTNNDQ